MTYIRVSGKHPLAPAGGQTQAHDVRAANEGKRRNDIRRGGTRTASGQGRSSRSTDAHRVVSLTAPANRTDHGEGRAAAKLDRRSRRPHEAADPSHGARLQSEGSGTRRSGRPGVDKHSIRAPGGSWTNRSPPSRPTDQSRDFCAPTAIRPRTPNDRGPLQPNTGRAPGTTRPAENR